MQARGHASSITGGHAHANRVVACCRLRRRDVRGLWRGAGSGVTCRPARNNWPSSPTANAGRSDSGALPERDRLQEEIAAVNDIVRRYARLQVPRYTSYPTAAEFTADIGAADQRRWLSGIDTSEAVSVYLHVPYCRELCLYCGCNTKKALCDDVISAYREALEREIALSATSYQDRSVSPGCTGAAERRASSALKGSHPSCGFCVTVSSLKPVTNTPSNSIRDMSRRMLAARLEGARRQPRQSWRAGRQSAGAGGDRPMAADAGRRSGRVRACGPPASAI